MTVNSVRDPGVSLSLQGCLTNVGESVFRCQSGPALHHAYGHIEQHFHCKGKNEQCDVNTHPAVDIIPEIVEDQRCAGQKGYGHVRPVMEAIGPKSRRVLFTPHRVLEPVQKKEPKDKPTKIMPVAKGISMDAGAVKMARHNISTDTVSNAILMKPAVFNSVSVCDNQLKNEPA